MSIIVGPGEIVGAKVLWRNNGITAISPSFRYGVKQATTDWYEGMDVKSIPINPNQEGEIDVTCPIPADWEIGAVAARVTAEGISEVLWEGSNIYEIGEIPPLNGELDIISSIMPLIMIMMVFMMITPMMKGMANETTSDKGGV